MTGGDISTSLEVLRRGLLAGAAVMVPLLLGLLLDAAWDVRLRLVRIETVLEQVDARHLRRDLDRLEAEVSQLRSSLLAPP